MRIKQKILLGLTVMVIVIVASSAYTYYATSRLTVVVRRLLSEELPTLSRLDRVENLISVMHTLETRVLTDNSLPDRTQFDLLARQMVDIVGQLGPLPFLPSSSTRVEQFKRDALTLVEHEQEAVRLEDSDDFNARQIATLAMSERLNVLAECTYLQNQCKSFLQDNESQNLQVGQDLQMVSLIFAGVSILLAMAMGQAGIGSFLVPLQNLVGVTHDVSRGHLREAPEHAKDEFGLLGLAFNDMVRNLRTRVDEVAQKNKILQDAEQTVQLQLRLSQNVQRSLVPRQPQMPGLEIAGRIQPAQRIGGDFYDVQTVNGCTTLAIGDASGHGIPAALFMVMGVILIREAGRQTSDPAEVLAGVNRRLRDQFPDETNDMFLTAAYLSHDAETGRLRYSVAGHEPAILLRAQDQALLSLETDGLLLGCMDEAHWEAREINVTAGDKIVLYTDGLTESRNAEGEFFGRDRLLDIMKEWGHLTCAELLNHIFDQVTSFRGDPTATDDITVLIAAVGEKGDVTVQAMSVPTSEVVN